MRIPDFLDVIEGEQPDRPANDEDRASPTVVPMSAHRYEDLSESVELTGAGRAQRPRRRREPRAPSWARAPRPSNPPPLRAC